MSQVYCWECEDSYGKSEVFDIPVFKKGYTVTWCFNCAMKQLEWTNYCFVSRPLIYKKFRIESVEDSGRKYQRVLEEVKLSYEAQFRKVKDYDVAWGDLHDVAQDVLNSDEVRT